MANDVLVSFGSEGQEIHYAVQNSDLAGDFGLGGEIVAAGSIPQNVSGGAFGPADPLIDEAYTTISSYDEAFRFVAAGWNIVKNINVKASGDESILFIADNFVHADMDFSEVTNDVHLKVFDGKRGNYVTGEGNDTVELTTATNSGYWSNTHKIMTGEGDDIVLIDNGDSDIVHTTIVNFTDGRFTIVEADLEEGDDVFGSDNDVKTMDIVDGGKGNDTIDTGYGEDIIEGGEDRGVIVQDDDALYTLLAHGDVLAGGEDADTFIYTSGDGFGYIGDGFDHILDFADEDVLVMNLQAGDVVDTEIATVQTINGDLTGAIVTVNGEAAVFLEDFTNTSEIFV